MEWMMLTLAVLTAAPPRLAEPGVVSSEDAIVTLPRPAERGELSLEEALARRRSVRTYGPGALTLAEISQLLWAAQGRTAADGGRTAPSAGALYPMELVLAAGDVEGLAPGLYRYLPDEHALRPAAAGDPRRELAAAALHQEWVRRAPACLVLAAVERRTRGKYGERATRYVPMEAGAVAENVYLQATALGLGTVLVGAFDDAAVHRAAGLAADEEPLGLMPVGRRP